MKKFLSVFLCMVLVLGLLPVSAFAATSASDANGDLTIAISATDLDDNGAFSVTVELTPSQTKDVYITAYAFAIKYDDTLVAPDMDAEGAYSKKVMGKTKYYGANVSGMTVKNFDTNVFEDSGNHYFLATDANPESFNGDDAKAPISVTFFFELTEAAKANGGIANMELAVGTASGTALFTVSTFSETEGVILALADTVSTSVAIPLTSIPVSGDVVKPAKNGDATASTIKSDTENATVAVTWDPAVTGDKFAASTVYTATVTVSPANGADFADDAEINYSGTTVFDGEWSHDVETDIFTNTVTFPATKDKELTALAITTQPTKLSGYVAGEALDTTGMVVKADYDDSSSDADFKDYKLDPATLAVGTTSVKVVANEDATKFATVTLTDAVIEMPSIEDIPAQDFTGAQIKPTVTVKPDGFTAYTLEYGENVNAGTGTVTLKPAVPYTFEPITKTFTINKVDVTVKADDKSKDYGATDPELTATVTGEVGGVEAAYTLARAEGEDVGTYDITVTLGDNPNYNVTATKGTFTINKAAYGTALTHPVTVPTKGATNKEIKIADLNLPETFVDAAFKSVDGKTGIVNNAAISDGVIKFSTDADVAADAPGTITATIQSKNWNDVTLTVNVTAKALELPADFWDQNVTVTPSVVYGTKDSEAVKTTEGTVTIKDPENNDVDGTLALKETDTVRNVGDATVTVVATFGDTTFEQNFTYTVTAKEVAVTWDDTELTYDGTAKKPTATAEGVNGETLTLTVSGEQTNAGSYTATANIDTVTGGNADKANYTLADSSKSTTFTIAPKALADAMVADVADQVYTGAAIEPAVTVSDGETALVADTDYTVSYANNTNAGEATVTVTGKGNYTGEASKTFKITAKAITPTVTVAAESVIYTGAEQEPAVTVKDGDTVISADNYDVSYTDNINVGTATVTVTLKGNYTGTGTTTFTITAKALTEAMVADVADQEYTGAAIEPVTLKDGETELTKGTDYDIAYTANIDAGEAATATITGKGNYTGTVTKTFKIAAKEVAVTWGETEFTYDGAAKVPTATATGVTGETINLTVTGEQTDAGEYTATAAIESVTGGQAKASNYTLTGETQTFTIKPATIAGRVEITADTEKVEADTVITAEIYDIPADATEYTYQWTKDGADIDGATDATYTVTSADAGTAIGVTVTFTGNYTGTLTSSTLDVARPVVIGGGGATVAERYRVTVAEAENGTVKVLATYNTKGTVVEVTATPNEGYKLVSITVVDANGKEYEVTLNANGGTFEMPAADVTVSAAFAALDDETFKFVDVPDDSYFAEAVYWAVANGVTNGTSATTISPYKDCTRAEIVTMLWRAAGSPEVELNGTIFDDVDASAYYFKAVQWAVANGITNGVADGKFAPNDSIDRAQMVTFLERMCKGKAESTEIPFEDVDADTYYADAVRWAVENGYTNGTSATTFSPDKNCNRAQAVTFLYRIFGK